MEPIIVGDYRHAVRVWTAFMIKNKGEYGNLYVPSNRFLLFNVSGNFLDMGLKIYALNSARFLSASGLAWQAALKRQNCN